MNARVAISRIGGSMMTAAIVGYSFIAVRGWFGLNAAMLTAVFLLGLAFVVVAVDPDESSAPGADDVEEWEG